MHCLKDRYVLTKEQSIFLAKKKRDENVYCGMKIPTSSKNTSISLSDNMNTLKIYFTFRMIQS